MARQPEQAKAVIIGGGIVGCSTAYHLARLGIGMFTGSGATTGPSPIGLPMKLSSCVRSCAISFSVNGICLLMVFSAAAAAAASAGGRKRRRP